MKKYLLLLLVGCCVSCQKFESKKKEGQDSVMKKKESWLYVIHSRNADMTPEKLVMSDPDKHILAFTDRPERKTSMIPADDFVKAWTKAFDVNPNATIAYYDKNKVYHGDAVELIDPRMENGSLVFTIKALDEVKISSKRDLGETAVFIDGGRLGDLGNFQTMTLHHSGVNQNHLMNGQQSDMQNDADKKCTMPSCKAKEEPMPEEEEKECTIPRCKPKEEPIPEEEEKECTFPTCPSR